MPMVYQQNINPGTRLGVWHITETEDFFLNEVPLKRTITHPHKRLQHLAGRLLLKEMFPDFPTELILIADTRKPFLENEAYHFSISHCGDYAAVMVSSKYRTGVDVELFTEKVKKIKHKFLSITEQQLIENIAEGSDPFFYTKLLTTAWSIKESLFKWYGSHEVDFIKHLHIKKIVLNDNEGIAHCHFLKDMEVELKVHFLFFNNNCISWVYSLAH